MHKIKAFFRQFYFWSILKTKEYAELTLVFTVFRKMIVVPMRVRTPMGQWSPRLIWVKTPKKDTPPPPPPWRWLRMVKG
jgi:hypothetical protein